MPNEVAASRRTPLAIGNDAFRSGRYAAAVHHYVDALVSYQALDRLLAGNIALASRRYRLERSRAARLRVAVCGWDLAHNAAGRVHTLAQLYETFAEVEIVGCLFPAHGREIWYPIRDTDIPVHSFLVEDEGAFLSQALQLVASHPCDVLHLSKPRLPNILFGTMYKLIWGAKVIMDVDDEELGFVGASEPAYLDQYVSQHRELPRLCDLHGQDWTRLAVGLASCFDGLSVVNDALRRHYGGTIVRHARNEDYFPLATEERKELVRKEFGIPLEAKVVLFFGTPRAFKGLLDTAFAIASLKRKDIFFVIVGNFPDMDLKHRLEAVTAANFIFVDNQPVTRTPDIVAVADVCVLVQDTKSVAASTQTPAKLSDALAAGLPVLATETPALLEVFAEKFLVPVTDTNLASQLEVTLQQSTDATFSRIRGRLYFEKELSFAANVPRLLNLLDRTANAALDEKLADFVHLLHSQLCSAVLQISTLKRDRASLPIRSTRKTLNDGAVPSLSVAGERLCRESCPADSLSA